MRLGWRVALAVVLCCLLAGVAASVGAAGTAGGPANAPEAAGVDDRSDVRTATEHDHHDVRAVGTDGGEVRRSIGSPASGGESADAVGEASGAADRRIELAQRYHLTPARPGEYTVRNRYETPDEVTGLEVGLPEDATVESRSGFERRDESTFAWDGSTERPSLTYRMPANRTVDSDGPIAARGNYLFADVGEWAIVSRPSLSHSWSWRGDVNVRLNRTPTVAGDGVASDTIVFLGPHEEYRHTAHGQTFRLVVPEAADLKEDPEDLFEALATASDRLRVGDRDSEVFLIAAPTEGISWGVRGLQTGPADVWVRDFERLDDADSVWFHEYVHSRQDYDAESDLRWFTEGSASYYAALLALEGGHIDFEAFRDRLSRGTASQYSDAVLSDPSTWQRNPNYHVGTLVAGDLDRRIRLASDSERSLQVALERLNEEDGTVGADRFEEALAEAGGQEAQEIGRRYVRSTERPSMWSSREHGEAFGLQPARFRYRHPGTYRVGGPYRNRTIENASPIVLVPGETLELDAVVENAGETAGDYDATLRVGGERRDGQTGRLGVGESAELTFSVAFDDVGEHTVTVGDAAASVTVREPATPRIGEFRAEPTEVEVGSAVELSIAVENGAAYPARTEVPITRDGTEVDRRTVRLDADERRTVTVTTTLDEPGRYTFGLGDASPETVTVSVAGDSPTGSLPGFGAVGALVALVTAVVLRRRTAP